MLQQSITSISLTNKEPKRDADGGKRAVAAAEGDDEDADAAQHDAEVVDEEGVHTRVVGDEAGQNAAQSVGDADHGQKERRLLRIHTL